MLVLPALYFRPTGLILCSFISGLLVDALLPQPYWLFAYGFPTIALFIRAIRGHLRTENSYHFISLAHIANILCILLLCAVQMIHLRQLNAIGVQILVIVILSHPVLPIVAFWFFSFERSLIKLLNIEHANENEFSIQ